MSEPLREVETTVAPQVEVVRYAILTALLYALAAFALGFPSQLGTSRPTLSVCGLFLWVWILLVRPALDALAGMRSARKELLFGAYFGLIVVSAFVLIDLAAVAGLVIHRGGAVVPETLLRLIIHAAAVAAAWRLRKEITQYYRPRRDDKGAEY